MRIKKVLHHTNVRIIINSSIDLAYEYELDGVHLNSKQLHELSSFPQRFTGGRFMSFGKRSKGG